VLGADTAMPAPEAETPATPDLPPEPSIRRRWLTGGSDEPAAPEPAAEAPKPKSGGTLFERMAAARGGARDDDDKDTPDIPRFLNRQNNQ